ncbi:helix-turn-helix transcriptional regulator [Frigidibacter sp. RF13]|uniref:helix-turn-helix transcriptional regulator n=1 Tax=Frigidibacter sp. RF13 TaxID=2997340 RepID=UPI00226F3DBD|nr:helix-turn-helix transcriptional regulator [Frigidibacter sp. RF13]MCY1126019.1 helix-turn-helix transcriptional regulator [Frigidibacter sp. RF13]
MTPEQLRAARALLGWSQDYLASLAQVSKRTIAGYELGQTAPNPSTYVSLIWALEDGGVEFIAENGGGPGVRLRKGTHG